MFEKFLEDIKEEYDRFENDGISKDAIELGEKIGQHLNCNCYPHYFTGNLRAKLVFVQLMPKQDNTDSHEFGGDRRFKSFEEYINFFENYGEIQYRDKESKFKSTFDTRQLLFLKQFGIIDFIEDNGSYQKNRENLARSIDRKLQLELVPYGSNNFEVKKKNANYLKEYIDRILGVITEVNREYIIFCGGIFKTLLKDYIVREEKHGFKLKKLDGSEIKSNCNYYNITIKFNGEEIKAGIAPTYAMQCINGILMEQYGQKCKEFYDSWD